MTTRILPLSRIIFLALSGIVALLVWLALAAVPTMAQDDASLHPTFPLLDGSGDNVLASGNPVSTMQTCGACHDTAFIASHSGHADAGLADLTMPGDAGDHAWDISSGPFGQWNPLTYRYLSPITDERLDLTTAEWIQTFGARHAGGGPTVYSRGGALLTELDSAALDAETSIADPASGELRGWNWQDSGVVEMNCFLCHTAAPNNEARVAALQAGQFGWANSATLLGSGIVDEVGGQLQWNPAAFDANGELQQAFVTIQDPADENCGQCHGLVHSDLEVPLSLAPDASRFWTTWTTGQIFSPQQLLDSGLNLQDKETLARPFDVHAERLVGCTDCHASLNNPIYVQSDDQSQPEHLTFDPRRLDIGDYLTQPIHEFAFADTDESAGRTCETCHTMETTHDWLPYKERHAAALACESCHAPTMVAPAAQSVDWTALRADGTPNVRYRGFADADASMETGLIVGFQPVLLPRQNPDGSASLAPYNLITAWYWVYGDPARPVPLRDLQAAWLDGEQYAGDVLGAFDANGDGSLDSAELVIDSAEKETIIAARLNARGLDNPRIAGETQPYAIHHGITSDEWAIQDCQTCHSEDSRLNQPIALADRLPGGVQPALTSADSFAGAIRTDSSGALYFEPQTETANLYILGHDSQATVDLLGALLFLGTVAGAALHGGFRYITARRRIPRDPELRRVYMYTVYERQWHWLQTVVILILLFTGMIIHKPNLFGAFSFSVVVQVHNVMAAILVVNAALAAFYHLASGEIRQFLPKPHGFFNDAITQAKFYLRGIFRGEPHPIEKQPERKLNPLQQVTYLAILNVLLPLQVISGALMWGAQQWPDIAARLGGLPFLAPLHTLVAWLFAAFIVMHVYLTTTGRKPMSGVQSMITGWEVMEMHSEHHREETRL